MNDLFRPHQHASARELLLKYFLFWSMKTGAMNRLMLPVLEHAIKWHHPLVNKMAEAALRHTALSVFFGGATLGETVETSKQLMARGIGVIIDYSASEGVVFTDPAQMNATLTHIVDEYRSVVAACAALNRLEHPERVEAALAVKISTLAPKPLLEKLGALLLKDRNAVLSHDEVDALSSIQGKVDRILAEAASQNVRCYIDAEESWINPVIERIYEVALAQGYRPTVTVQAYLKDSGALVDRLLALPNPPDIKLVRGAYIGLAQERGNIWATKEETDLQYNTLLKRLHEDGRIEVITVASHNQESLSLAGRLQEGKTELYTATLLGMGDMLDSSSLPRTKYVPYPQRADQTEEAGLWVKRGTAHVISNLGFIYRAQLTEMLLHRVFHLEGDAAKARYGHADESPVLGAIAYFGRRGKEFAGTKGEEGLSRGDMEFLAVRKELSIRLGHAAMNILEGISLLQKQGINMP